MPTAIALVARSATALVQSPLATNAAATIRTRPTARRDARTIRADIGCDRRRSARGGSPSTRLHHGFSMCTLCPLRPPPCRDRQLCLFAELAASMTHPTASPQVDPDDEYDRGP